MRRSEVLESGSRKQEPCLGSAMYRLACCLLFLGCLQPLLSLAAPGSRARPLQLAAADGGGSARDELDRASLSLLRGLLGTPGAETAAGLGKADAGTNVHKARGNTRKAFSGQDPDILLNRLLARVREQHGKRGHPSECFWKYCV